MAGYVFEAKDGRVFGIWVRREELVIVSFEKEDMRFEPSQKGASSVGKPLKGNRPSNKL